MSRRFIYNDGGREAAGYKGKTGDCGTRAIAIATGMPYQEVYDMVIAAAKLEKRRKPSHPRTGIWRETMDFMLDEKGWTWVPTMKFVEGCTTHLKSEELPAGNIIVRLSRHYAAVIDGVLHDIIDSSRDGTRCVYGYWKR